MALKFDHPVLIKADPSSIIYRYLDLEKFEYLLKDRALFFCRADKFSDPFEASTLKKEAEYRIIDSKKSAEFYQRTITEAEAQKSSDDLANLHKKLRKTFVVNCWHINNSESDAMWRLYLKTNEGVAVQTTVQKLTHSFEKTMEEIYISKVRYLNYETDTYFHRVDYPVRSYNLLAPIVHKRTAFSHESELRLFQQITEAEKDEDYWNNSPNSVGKNIACDIEKLVEKIILPPTSDVVVFEKVKSIMNKYGFHFLTEKSKLNDEPIY